MTLPEIIRKGGLVNVIIAGLGILILVITAERILYFAQTRRRRKSGQSGGRTGEAAVSPAGRMKELYRETENLEESERNDRFEKLGAVLRDEMERGLWILSFITACAPSLGLLGTVTGLIKAFQKIAESGMQVNIQILSEGIWEALLTTACGLAVALPALLAVKVFGRIIDRRCLDMSLAFSSDESQLNISPSREKGKETEEKIGYARF